MKKNQSKELAKRGTTAVITDDYADDAGAGFEHADKDSYSIPRLYMLQKGSPQVNKRDAKYVEDAEPGLIYNTVTRELYEKLVVIPVLFRQTWVEWLPERGGFVAEHYRKSRDWIAQQGAPDLTPEGNEIVDTRSFFLLTQGGDPVVLSMSSSGIRTSMDWMTVMQNKRGQSNGRSFPLPMFANIFQLEGEYRTKDDYDWFGWRITDTGDLVPQDSDIYQQCKTLKEQVDSGVAQAVDPEQGGGGTVDEDIRV